MVRLRNAKRTWTLALFVLTGLVLFVAGISMIVVAAVQEKKSCGANVGWKSFKGEVPNTVWSLDLADPSTTAFQTMQAFVIELVTQSLSSDSNKYSIALVKVDTLRTGVDSGVLAFVSVIYLAGDTSEFPSYRSEENKLTRNGFARVQGKPDPMLFCNETETTEAPFTTTLKSVSRSPKTPTFVTVLPTKNTINPTTASEAAKQSTSTTTSSGDNNGSSVRSSTKTAPPMSPTPMASSVSVDGRTASITFPTWTPPTSSLGRCVSGAPFVHQDVVFAYELNAHDDDDDFRSSMELQRLVQKFIVTPVDFSFAQATDGLTAARVALLPFPDTIRYSDGAAWADSFASINATLHNQLEMARTVVRPRNASDVQDAICFLALQMLVTRRRLPNTLILLTKGPPTDFQNSSICLRFVMDAGMHVVLVAYGHNMDDTNVRRLPHTKSQFYRVYSPNVFLEVAINIDFFLRLVCSTEVVPESVTSTASTATFTTPSTSSATSPSSSSTQTRTIPSSETPQTSHQTTSTRSTSTSFAPTTSTSAMPLSSTSTEPQSSESSTTVPSTKLDSPSTSAGTTTTQLRTSTFTSSFFTTKSFTVTLSSTDTSASETTSPTQPTTATTPTADDHSSQFSSSQSTSATFSTSKTTVTSGATETVSPSDTTSSTSATAPTTTPIATTVSSSALSSTETTSVERTDPTAPNTLTSPQTTSSASEMTETSTPTSTASALPWFSTFTPSVATSSSEPPTVAVTSEAPASTFGSSLIPNSSPSTTDSVTASTRCGCTCDCAMA